MKFVSSPLLRHAQRALSRTVSARYAPRRTRKSRRSRSLNGGGRIPHPRGERAPHPADTARQLWTTALVILERDNNLYPVSSSRVAGRITRCTRSWLWQEASCCSGSAFSPVTLSAETRRLG